MRTALSGHQGAAGADVQPVQADLSRYDGLEQLYAVIASTGRPVDAAALNAGIGHGGAFVVTDLADEIRRIHLNVTSTVRLAKRLFNGEDEVVAGRPRPRSWASPTRCRTS